MSNGVGNDVTSEGVTALVTLLPSLPFPSLPNYYSLTLILNLIPSNARRAT